MKEARSELVRIDDSGVAHPIGGVASQRMRTRRGTFRLLPAPDHVVFMRYTGEDGRRDADDGAVVRLAGEITSPGALCDILALLAQTGWRGELAVLATEASRSLFFEQGSVVGVQTSVEEERIGSILYRFGMLTLEQHASVMDRVRQGERFGSAAVKLGFISQDKVYQALAKQIEETVYAALIVSDGTFFFLDGFDDSRLVARHAVSANALLMDAATRMDEMRYFREKIPSSDYVPAITEKAEPCAEEYRSTFEAIDGKRDLEEIGRVTGRGDFATTKDIYALLQSKHVAIHPPKLSGGLSAIVATANEALRRVCQIADEESVGGELRENLSSFAVGAGVYDILFRGAGPDESGMFDTDTVAENASLVAGGDDPEQILRQMLYDYVGFAMFSLGGILGPEKEAEITKEVSDVVSRLRPQG